MLQASKKTASFLHNNWFSVVTTLLLVLILINLIEINKNTTEIKDGIEVEIVQQLDSNSNYGLPKLPKLPTL